MRYITLPAINKRVSLRAYIDGVKHAKANPTVRFKHGLTCWWACTGKDIVDQFRTGMMDRITQGIPYSQRA